jgi:hypothetical protein
MAEETPSEHVPPGVDTSRPSPARPYDHYSHDVVPVLRRRPPAMKPPVRTSPVTKMGKHWC